MTKKFHHLTTKELFLNRKILVSDLDPFIAFFLKSNVLFWPTKTNPDRPNRGHRLRRATSKEMWVVVDKQHYLLFIRFLKAIFFVGLKNPSVPFLPFWQF